MSLSPAGDRALVAMMAAHRIATQPVLTSRTTTILPKRGFTWGICHKWDPKRKTMGYKILSEKTNKPSPYYPYLEQKFFTRRFQAAQGWRSSSQWKNSAANHQEQDKEPGTRSSNNRETIYSDDWLSAWHHERIRNFEAFKKKIDADPYMALFGHSHKVLGWASKMASETAAKLEEDLNDLRKETHKFSENDKPECKKDVDNSPFPMKKEKTSSPSHSENNQAKQDTENNAYYIDPITLHKIEKKESQASSSTETLANNPPKVFDIPVKTFQPSPPKSSVLQRGHGYTQVDDWLAREGFRVSPNSPKAPSGGEHTTSIKPDTPKSKLETSLDRQAKNTDVDAKKSDVLSKTATKKTDDVRNDFKSSTVQAQSSNENDPVGAVEDSFVTKRIEDDHSAASSSVSEALEAINKRHINEPLDAETITAKPTPEPVLPESETSKSENLSLFENHNTRRIQSLLVPLKTKINLMTADYETLRRKWLEATNRLREKQSKRLEMQTKLLNKEIEAQKLAMKAVEERGSSKDVSNRGSEPNNATKSTTINAEHHGEGDVSPNVGDFATRDRYYKRKAPHAACEMEAKTQRIAKEMALVREVRSIYEDTYGTIDTKHRQHELRGAEGDLSPNVVNLAYSDRWYKRPAPISALSPKLPPSTTPTTKSTPSFTHLKDDPTPSILPNGPAGAIASLRTQLADQSRELTHLRAALRRSQQQQKQQHPPPSSTPPNDKVTRTEPVFSGPKRGGCRGERRRARKLRRRVLLRHVLWTGGVTAGACYAVGVLVEWMG